MPLLLREINKSTHSVSLVCLSCVYYIIIDMALGPWRLYMHHKINASPGTCLQNMLFFCMLTIPSAAAVAAAKSLQSCPTLCNPIDSSPPGSTVPGILLARTLEWVAISFSNAWKWKGKVKSLSRVQLLVTPWTAAHQAPPSMGFSRQEYWSGVPLPSPMIPSAQYLKLPACYVFCVTSSHQS